jgi:UDP-N-acetylglucosamine--N-acetylmuramyl-(pentapeptide) pyrophosphoryl-undecaprenol N-acetylglucosamine transferase
LIALSYKETDNIPKEYKGKIIHTGDIIRTSIRNLPEKKNFNSPIFNLFVVGGSQGALIFSRLIPDTIERLKKLNQDIQINITQQVSDEHAESIAKRYKALGIEHNLQRFFHNIVDIYSKSDLVIARSGASTIAELTSVGLPAIYVPLPSAAENHQAFNASALVNDNASWSYAQSHITPDILARKLNELIKDRSQITAASKNLLTRKSNGAKYLADTVLKIIA